MQQIKQPMRGPLFGQYLKVTIRAFCVVFVCVCVCYAILESRVTDGPFDHYEGEGCEWVTGWWGWLWERVSRWGCLCVGHPKIVVFLLASLYNLQPHEWGTLKQDTPTWLVYLPLPWKAWGFPIFWNSKTPITFHMAGWGGFPG